MQQPNYPTMGIGKHHIVDSMNIKKDNIRLKNNDYAFYQEDKVRPVRMEPYADEALTMEHMD
jgi:hypothetical protein